MKRKSYEKEFKLKIVEIANNTDKSQQDICEEYGIGLSTLSRWIRQYNNTKSFVTEDNLPEHEKEIRRLRKELKQAQMENDILKQAALIIGKK